MKRLILGTMMLLMLSACSGNSQTEGQYTVNYSATTVNPKEGKSVLIISASPRKGGNTDMLADAFMKGATQAGGKVEKIFLGDYDIKFFKEEHQEMVGQNDTADDDAAIITRKMMQADVIVLASPVYFLNIDGQMKTLIDRTFAHFMEISDKEFYYLTACADPYESTADYAIEGFRGFTKCIPNATERGMVKAIGMGRKGGVKNTQYEQQAYQLGLTINK